jgi:hypothetical protein
MTTALLYALIAMGTIVIVGLLLRPNRERAAADTEISGKCARGLWDGSGLSLAERILDPADYLWLRDELGFPQLARALARSRRQMALKWLKAARRSFDELVRTPEPGPVGGPPSGTAENWQLLRLTLRFHLVLGYAFLVVWFCGPYHRLILPIGWVQSLPTFDPQRNGYGAADVTRFS